MRDDRDLIDRRQFAIMPVKYEHKDFEYIELSNGKILSYHKELKINSKDDSFLLGHAFSCVREDIILPADDAEMASWSGRWVYFNKDKLYLDASGTLGVYYYISENGEVYLSSSLHILRKLLELKWIADTVPEREWGGIIDYFPNPLSPVEKTKKLLPTQVIDINTGSIEFRTNYFIPRYRNMTNDERADKIIDAFCRIFKNIEREFPDEVWITITGGYDSRTNLAVAKKSGIKFKAYTAIRNTTKPFDFEQAKLVCEKLGIKHHTIDDTIEPIDGRAEIFDEHCGGHVTFGTEKTQFICGSDVEIKNKAVVLWGTAWISMNFYPELKWMNYKYQHDLDILYKYINDQQRGSAHFKECIEEWMNYACDNRIEGMKPSKRFYLDQRTGAWLSSAHQAIDLIDSIRIAPSNCQYIYELLASYPKKEGDNRDKQDEIICKCCPELKGLIYEPVRPLSERIKGGILGILERLGMRV